MRLTEYQSFVANQDGGGGWRCRGRFLRLLILREVITLWAGCFVCSSDLCAPNENMTPPSPLRGLRDESITYWHCHIDTCDRRTVHELSVCVILCYGSILGLINLKLVRTYFGEYRNIRLSSYLEIIYLHVFL